MKWLKSGETCSRYPLQVKRPKFGSKASNKMDSGMVENVEVVYALALLCGLDLLSGFHIENVCITNVQDFYSAINMIFHQVFTWEFHLL